MQDVRQVPGVLTTRFVHVHIPRTAGSTLRAVLGAIAGAGVVESRPHLPYGHMAAICERRGIPVPPAFAIVRNPYSWYVSQWSWLTFIGQGMDWSTTFRQYMEVVRGNVSSKGPLGAKALNFGSMTSAWNYLQAGNCRHYARFERFPDSAIETLVRLVPDLITRAELRKRIKAVGVRRRVPISTGKHYGDYRQYYDSQLRKWVREWDGSLLQRFGYVFDESEQPVTSQEKRRGGGRPSPKGHKLREKQRGDL